MTSNTSASLPSWVNTISDARIKGDITEVLDTGTVSFASMQGFFQDIANEVASSALTASQFQDLKTVVDNIGAAGASPYVQFISKALVEGNANNVRYTGGQLTSVSMGNLAVGSGYTQFNELVEDWFLGENNPTTYVNSTAARSPFYFSYMLDGLSLYSGGGPSINDINQGNLGDCYLLCALGEVAQQDPNAIEQMFRDNGNGTYGVRFFIDGAAQWVTVNDTLPTVSSGTYSPPFNDEYVASPQNIWVSLVEKAYAELSTSLPINTNTSGWAGNSYSSVGDGGYPDISLEQITGASQLTYLFSGKTDNNWQVASATATSVDIVNSPTVDADTLAFQALVNAFNANDDVVLSSYTNTYDASGNYILVSSHSFSMIGYNATNQTIELRNPWGAISSGQSWETTFSITLSQLANTGSTTPGDDNGDYFAFDNNNPSATTPTLQTSSFTTASNGAAFSNFASAISLSDPNGVGASGITYTISYTGNGGVMMLNGAAQAAGTSFTVNGASLAELSYIPSTSGGVDTVTISADDGISGTAPSTLTITSPNTPGPVVTAVPANGSITARVSGETFTLAQLFAVTDADPNATISEYQFEDDPPAGSSGGGNFLLPGIIPADGTPFIITASQLSSLTYQIAGNGGAQTLSMQANDGTAANPHWSNVATVTVTSNAIPPTVSAHSVTLPTTDTVSDLAALAGISAVDQNGVSVSYYTLSYSGTGGVLWSGVFAYGSGTSFTVPASDLSSLSYVPSVYGGTDTFTVSATDSYTTGPATTFTVTSPATPGPVFTAATATITPTRNQTYATTSASNPLGLYSEFDAFPGASIVQYEFYVGDAAGGLGNLLLSGNATPNDTPLVVNASDIRNVSYQAIAGSEELAIRANDGTAPDPHWGAWSVITVTTPTTSFSPASATISSTRGQIYATTASNPLGLYTETDPSGATVVQYQFYVNDSAGGLGTLLLNGVAQANDAAQTVNASALSTISYQAIAGSELLAIRANDGTVAHPVWGAWSVITATAPAATLGANFTTANATVSAASGQVYASTTAASPLGLFSAVADTTGGTIAQYDFFDSASAGSIGSFLVNNVAQANGTHVTVSASALSTVTYSISSGTQAISIRANDGTVAHPVWGAWSTVTVSVGAVFTATNTTISPTRDQTYTTTTASNPLGLYSVSDETGNAITQYEFDVNDTAGGLGNLFVSGVAQANDAVLVVNASVLNTVSYQAIAGSEALAIRANDGTVSNPRWGAWSVITVTAPAVTSGASFTDANATVSAASGHVYSTTTASSPLGLFSAAADTTGGSIAQYEFFDSASAGSVGGFLVSGATETNGAVLAVSASALSTVTYSISSGSQAISIRANDGTLAHPVWGAWTTVTVTVGAVATATNATITPTRDQTYTTTTPSNPLGLYSVSDETGNAITQYEFDVNDTAGGLGNLLVSGVAQANDAVLVVNASALNTVSYQAIAGSEVLAIRANDGTASNPHWGAWSLITVNAPAVTATGASFAAINATVTLGSSHTYSTTSAASPLGLYNAVTDPSGGVIAQYDFFDNASAGSVGSFLVNNVAQANGTHVTVSASALNTATYSISSGTQAISIRANDGTVAHPIWGAWTTVTLTAPAVTGAPVSSALAVIPDLLSNSSPVLSAAATSIVSPAALLQHDTQLTPLFVIHSA